MVISENGITLNVTTNLSHLSFSVGNQTKKFTDTLRFLNHVVDEETGYSLRSN